MAAPDSFGKMSVASVPCVIIVTRPPGAGKTTVARNLVTLTYR